MTGPHDADTQDSAGPRTWRSGALVAGLAMLVGIRAVTRPSPRATGSALPEELSPTQLDLLKLEYGRAADRYENIYKAIWQNFQYVVVAAAAIASLAFGKAKAVYVVFGALTPIVFWLLATFIPMNHYGEQARTRLKQLEAAFNHRYFRGGDPTGSDPAKPQLRHYASFRDQPDRPPWRVSSVVTLFGWIATTAWLLAMSASINCAVRGMTCFAPAPKHTAAGSVVVTTDSVLIALPRDSQTKDARDSVRRAHLVPAATKQPTSQSPVPGVSPVAPASSTVPPPRRP